MWSALGHSDTWLMLNSIMWEMITVVLVFTVTLRRFGTVAAVIALAFSAVMGSEVYFANELRAYAMLGTMMMLSWIAADHLLARYSFKAGVPLILTLIVTGGLHSFGVIASSCALVYALPFGSREVFRRNLPVWIGISAVVGIGVLPWVVNGSMRHVGHLGPVTLEEVIHTVSGWVLGYRAIAVPPIVQTVVAVLIALVLISALLWVPRLRRVVSCYIIWPLAFTTLICLVWKPIWLFRPFSFCAPFLAVTLGGLLGQLFTAEKPVSNAVRAACAAGVAAVLVAAGWFTYQQATTPWKTQYREAANYLRAHVQPGDTIYIPDMITFWGVARYLVSPTWGSVLKVQDPLNQDHSPIWPHIYERLGPANLDRLHLSPQTRRVDGYIAPLYIGWSPLPQVQNAHVVWIAGPADIPYDFSLDEVELCPHSGSESVHFTEVRVFRITCETGSPASVAPTPPTASLH
jgi:hypothetical protein